MTIPLVSIVTCVRDPIERHFIECAESVLQGCSIPVEWIVIDDGSCPTGRAVITGVLRDSQSHSGRTDVRQFRLPNSRGLSVARNLGLDSARGLWTVVLDSDDRLTPGLWDVIQSAPCSAMLVSVDSVYFDSQSNSRMRTRVFERLFRRHGGTALDPFLWFDFYYHGIIARTSLLKEVGGYRAEYAVGEDQDVLFRAIERCGPQRVHFDGRIGYEYRNNPVGVCKTRWDEVLANYSASMLEGVYRRGQSPQSCRFGGVRDIDGSPVDCYEYQDDSGEWLSWPNAVSRWRLPAATASGREREATQ